MQICALLQHKDFEDIEGRLKRRESLIFGSTAAQRLSRKLPVEVVSDPLNDVENDPYDDGSDVQKQLRGHQVLLFDKYTLMMCTFLVRISWHAMLVDSLFGKLFSLFPLFSTFYTRSL